MNSLVNKQAQHINTACWTKYQIINSTKAMDFLVIGVSFKPRGNENREKLDKIHILDLRELRCTCVKVNLY